MIPVVPFDFSVRIALLACFPSLLSLLLSSMIPHFPHAASLVHTITLFVRYSRPFSVNVDEIPAAVMEQKGLVGVLEGPAGVEGAAGDGKRRRIERKSWLDVGYMYKVCYVVLCFWGAVAGWCVGSFSIDAGGKRVRVGGRVRGKLWELWMGLWS